MSHAPKESPAMSDTKHIEIAPDVEAEVTAVPVDGGYAFKVEVTQDDDEGNVHSQADSGQVYSSPAKALHEGVAFAEWVAEGDEGEEAPTAGKDLVVEVSREDGQA
jgi:hypothetical protein